MGVCPNTLTSFVLRQAISSKEFPSARDPYVVVNPEGVVKQRF